MGASIYAFPSTVCEAGKVLVHASCVAIDGAGVLLRGPSGAGKSDLALRLIDEGARLVADDQVELRAAGGRILAGPAPMLAGLIEARGIGILRLDHLTEVALALVVDLTAQETIERMPEPAQASLLGIALPAVAIDPRTASATAKVRLAMRVAAGSIMRAP